jgi:pimeloyl-ACP methyl ester carboxylesterase
MTPVRSHTIATDRLRMRFSESGPYWNPAHPIDAALEAMLLEEVLKSATGDDGYPGDMTTSEHWPGVAPGTRGILNALAPKYCNWAALPQLEPKPPVLWVHGSEDVVVADGSPWEMGTLGAAGLVPGWPGEDVFPPQPMVSQIRRVLTEYREAGGHVEMEWFEGSGHGPLLDAPERFAEVFFRFLG